MEFEVEVEIEVVCDCLLLEQSHPCQRPRSRAKHMHHRHGQRGSALSVVAGRWMVVIPNPRQRGTCGVSGEKGLLRGESGAEQRINYLLVSKLDIAEPGIPLLYR